jgi:hypothetical protein
MLVGIAILCFIYAPLLTFLRAPPTREEKKVGIDNPSVENDNGSVIHKKNGHNGMPANNLLTEPLETTL